MREFLRYMKNKLMMLLIGFIGACFVGILTYYLLTDYLAPIIQQSIVNIGSK